MSSLDSTLPTLRSTIDQATRAAVDRSCAPTSENILLAPFTQAAYQATASGKRFRAICAYIGAAVASGSALGHIQFEDLAAAVELYQASALVHDDVIDHADTRRGAPTPHLNFAQMHRQNGWLGDDEDFGEASAILLGDLLFSAAEAAMVRFVSTLPSPRASVVMDRYTLMHTEVAIGQYLDVLAEQRPIHADADDAFSLPEILEVVRLKSARYSVVHPVALGALAVGAGLDLIAGLEATLMPWGTAFQLRDDDLGLFGDPQVTGKPAGDDLLEGKRTALMAITWANSSPTERHVLADAFNSDRQRRVEMVDSVREIVSARGREDHELFIEQLVHEGAAAVPTADLTPDSVALLHSLGDLLTRRHA
ncbi:polyprenyl synthetase family protein [Schaalia sp. Marseille-Q2122]|uniref:polyprenyl synthetase family protein n=1 Tax=Schaalia sp. Marseille-Q2122 TaxID=2736604 RepID=UPI00158D1B61|nr:polyprenyl synthetase family protein [Schaalia sp. Marseille-Q2122]